MKEEVLKDYELVPSYTWRRIFRCLGFTNRLTETEGYSEATAVQIDYSPMDHVMSWSSNLFNPAKAAAMYFWYKTGDRTDRSILKYFDEYMHCVDENHKVFNSNYGFYAYTQGGLNRCIEYLKKNIDTRQACFCINNNNAMSEDSIDKLCTNTIQFMIREYKLEMIVQMRSSNFLTLLPYDAFMFAVFYQHVFSALRNSKWYELLKLGDIHLQIASLHFYDADIKKFKQYRYDIDKQLIDFYDNNWQTHLEDNLIYYMKEWKPEYL